MSSLSIFSTLEEVIPVSDEDLRAGIGSLAPQIVTGIKITGCLLPIWFLLLIDHILFKLYASRIEKYAEILIPEYVFYLRNVERKNRAEKDVAVADKDVAVAENVRLGRKLDTLQKEMDKTMKSKCTIVYHSVL